MIETEVKIKVREAKGLKERLLGLGCVLARDRYLETNVLYDHRGGPLFAKREALRLRVADYIVKPFNINRLFECIEAVLEEKAPVS